MIVEFRTKKLAYSFISAFNYGMAGYTLYIKQSLYLLRDFRFWILFFFLIRMYGITKPPLEIGHDWRQTDGMMIARNFYERDPNILYPTVDVAGEKTGIVGCEFPILNYLVYLVSLVFGFQHWYGRLIVLIFSTSGIFFFHKLIRKYANEPSAFCATIILLVSLWFSYSRKNIPDTFGVSLCLIGLYYALEYVESGKFGHLLLFFVLALLGCLSKILAATILTVLLIPIVSKNILLSRKVLLSIFSAGILMGVFWWYFLWVPYLNKSYDFEAHFFTGLSFAEGFAQMANNWAKILERFYETPLRYVGFAVFLFSAFYFAYIKSWFHLAVFSLPFLSFMVMLIKTGSNIVEDNYYILTLIPAMAFLAGCGLAQLKSEGNRILILILIAVEGIATQANDFRFREPLASLRKLETIMDGFSHRNDLVAINAGAHNPTAMYFAHRRGWASEIAELSDTTYLSRIKNQGCKFVVVAKELYGDVVLDYPIVHESQYFKIYSLNAEH